MDLQSRIEDLWEERDGLGPGNAEEAEVVREAVALLDSGQERVAEVAGEGPVVVNGWLKKAVLLFFKVSAMEVTELGPFEYVDRIPLKHGFEALGVRVVPGASARWGSFIGRGAVLMPSYVNIGAYVGPGTMVDTWATVGSCAQVGSDVHLAGGVGVGGVLEPPQAAPVVIGDGANIGSRSMITQGARVGKGAVLGEGSLLNPSIPVIDAATGKELSRGEVPPWSVAVAATRSRQFPGGAFGLPCMLVISWLKEGERHSKAQLEDVLREHAAGP
ncbi:MAG TPA: 2,3,4,5-tetrahydropyridine-2,6-dicarboxylate N-succinyltransferase [Acidimicrobiales bacterium]|nr:2,3,4,5-tetrahydropyridine-2,6-dicarboxylate N-succinyltransferase [Acidimicrobiales bacterium]